MVIVGIANVLVNKLLDVCLPVTIVSHTVG